MRIAFHAPMKAPDDPRPSGDRTVARNLLAALRLAGHEIDYMPRFRSYDGAGDDIRQARIERAGRHLANRIAAHCERGTHAPDLWFTYHPYHKAPDWLGPAVSRRLGIPYVVAEASVAMKQRGGPWARGHEATVAALERADLVFGLNPNDLEGVLPHLKPGASYHPLRPFLDPEPYREIDCSTARTEFSRLLNLPSDKPWIVVCAMMRADQKRSSYLLLAEALTRSGLSPFHLLIAGDGPARGEIEAAFSLLGGGVRFLGALSPEPMRRLLAAGDLLAWPAIKEAYGMALLEGAFSGLPTVAGRSPGVASIVAEGETGLLAPQGDAEAFAAATAQLLCDPALRTRMSAAARARAFAGHTIEAAAKRLAEGLAGLSSRPISHPSQAS